MPAGYEAGIRRPFAGDGEISVRYHQEVPGDQTFASLEPGTRLAVYGMHSTGAPVEMVIPTPPPLNFFYEGACLKPLVRLTKVVLRPNELRATLTYATWETKLPRIFVPGIHKHIPVSLVVGDDTPILYEAPPTLKERATRGSATGA